MEAAREAVDKAAHRPLLIAVTILTSLDANELHEVGLSGNPADNVLRLACLAESAGLDGVVCSPQEVTALREIVADDFRLVTPGVRPRKRLFVWGRVIWSWDALLPRLRIRLRLWLKLMRQLNRMDSVISPAHLVDR